jgi:hypothetical protein
MDARMFKAQWDEEIQVILKDLRARKERTFSSGADCMEGQPSEGAGCFIISLPRRDLIEWRAGAVTCCSIQTAAKRVCEQTHRLATGPEISTFLGNSRKVYDALLAAENARGGRHTVTIEAELPRKVKP